MLDDMLGYIENIRERPVWQPIPDAVRNGFRSAIPRGPTELSEVHETFLKEILPYGSGNAHPGFFGWVQGAGTPVGMLAEMLAAGMNPNLGGRDHMPIEVERQVVEWMREIFGFPAGTTGLFVTGTSMANLMAMVVARDAASRKNLTAYASSAVHGCIAKAMDVIGIGRDALRLIRTNTRHQMDVAALEQTMEADRRRGFAPFLIVGTAGTVDVGAIDDLTALADVAQRQNVWFHVDGAYAALAMLAPELAPKLQGIERADSLAFDFHKWGQVPYAAGFLLVRHGRMHRDSFASSAAYLRRESRGLAAGSDWPCDLGVDLSRGFQALKTWFTLKVYGTDALGAVISQTCSLARYLAEQIEQASELELMAPVQLNIVCFRFRALQSNEVNASIVIELQEAGEVAPSTTILDGWVAIRVAIVNHRTTRRELDLLVETTLSRGRALSAEIWEPRRMRETALAELERELSTNADSVDLRVERAGLLGELGRIREAREEYLAVLARDPAHRETLNKLGTLLYGTGYRTAARTAYSEAVAQYPNDLESLVNLANVLAEEGDVVAAREHYLTALKLKADSEYRRAAHQGMARVLTELGDEPGAEMHRRTGYTGNALASLPYRGEKAPLNVLLLVSAEGGNIPVRHLLDDRVFQTHVLTADYFTEDEPIPFHNVVFNSIGDADLAQQALGAAGSIVARTVAPVINDPRAVSLTGREENARRFRNLPGAVTPLTANLSRDLLESADGLSVLSRLGFAFPLLMRTPGFHTGRYFVKVERATHVAAALAELPGQQITVIQYLDARGRDGKSRKYRAMMIDGQIYPLHAAISSHWKIHYFTAEMANNPEHRAEDAAFLADMPGVVGAAAMAALARIQSTLGLDYAGIDFGLNERGEVLVFEANATMVVLRPEHQAQWAYRWPAVERIQGAVRKMLLDRSVSRS